MASPGAGTTNHLLSELVQSTLGLQWVTAHYRGNAPAINDLIGGQVQFAFDQISVGLPFIKNGNVRALAVTGSHRASWIPDVPTFAELGYKEFDGQTFTGLFAPAGTPAEIVTKLHDTMAAILKDPAIVEKFNALGAEAVTMTPAAFTRYLERRGRQMDSRRPQGEYQEPIEGPAMRIDPAELGAEQAYRLITGIVVPRPIAWVDQPVGQAASSTSRRSAPSPSSRRSRRCWRSASAARPESTRTRRTIFSTPRNTSSTSPTRR